jgi:hypothetical protein
MGKPGNCWTGEYVYGLAMPETVQGDGYKSGKKGNVQFLYLFAGGFACIVGR